MIREIALLGASLAMLFDHLTYLKSIDFYANSVLLPNVLWPDYMSWDENYAVTHVFSPSTLISFRFLYYDSYSLDFASYFTKYTARINANSYQSVFPGAFTNISALGPMETGLNTLEIVTCSFLSDTKTYTFTLQIADDGFNLTHSALRTTSGPLNCSKSTDSEFVCSPEVHTSDVDLDIDVGTDPRNTVEMRHVSMLSRLESWRPYSSSFPGFFSTAGDHFLELQVASPSSLSPFLYRFSFSKTASQSWNIRDFTVALTVVPQNNPWAGLFFFYPRAHPDVTSYTAVSRFSSELSGRFGIRLNTWGATQVTEVQLGTSKGVRTLPGSSVWASSDSGNVYTYSSPAGVLTFAASSFDLNTRLLRLRLFLNPVVNLADGANRSSNSSLLPLGYAFQYSAASLKNNSMIRNAQPPNFVMEIRPENLTGAVNYYLPPMEYSELLLNSGFLFLIEPESNLAMASVFSYGKPKDTLYLTSNKTIYPILFGMNSIVFRIFAEDYVSATGWILWIYVQSNDTSLALLRLTSPDADFIQTSENLYTVLAGEAESTVGFVANASQGNATIAVRTTLGYTGTNNSQGISGSVDLPAEVATGMTVELVVTAESRNINRTVVLSIARRDTCGNGRRWNISEACDTGPVQPIGSGCFACRIESGWECGGGSETTPDVCSLIVIPDNNTTSTNSTQQSLPANQTVPGPPTDTTGTPSNTTDNSTTPTDTTGTIPSNTTDNSTTPTGTPSNTTNNPTTPTGTSNMTDNSTAPTGTTGTAASSNATDNSTTPTDTTGTIPPSNTTDNSTTPTNTTGTIPPSNTTNNPTTPTDTNSTQTGDPPATSTNSGSTNSTNVNNSTDPATPPGTNSTLAANSVNSTDTSTSTATNTTDTNATGSGSSPSSSSGNPPDVSPSTGSSPLPDPTSGNSTDSNANSTSSSLPATTPIPTKSHTVPYSTSLSLGHLSLFLVLFMSVTAVISSFLLRFLSVSAVNNPTITVVSLVIQYQTIALIEENGTDELAIAINGLKWSLFQPIPREIVVAERKLGEIWGGSSDLLTNSMAIWAGLLLIICFHAVIKAVSYCVQRKAVQVVGEFLSFSVYYYWWLLALQCLVADWVARTLSFSAPSSLFDGVFLVSYLGSLCALLSPLPLCLFLLRSRSRLTEVAFQHRFGAMYEGLFLQRYAPVALQSVLPAASPPATRGIPITPLTAPSAKAFHVLRCAGMRSMEDSEETPQHQSVLVQSSLENVHKTQFYSAPMDKYRESKGNNPEVQAFAEEFDGSDSGNRGKTLWFLFANLAGMVVMPVSIRAEGGMQTNICGIVTNAAMAVAALVGKPMEFRRYTVLHLLKSIFLCLFWSFFLLSAVNSSLLPICRLLALVQILSVSAVFLCVFLIEEGKILRKLLERRRRVAPSTETEIPKLEVWKCQKNAQTDMTTTDRQTKCLTDRPDISSL